MDRKTILLIVSGAVVVILAIVAYVLVKPDEAALPTDTTVYGTGNPLEEKPELNPTEATNPFANVKTNPFE